MDHPLERAPRRRERSHSPSEVPQQQRPQACGTAWVTARHPQRRDA